MSVTDVKCSQATRQIIPNSRTGSFKASVSEAVVRTWHRAHVVKGRPERPSVAFRDETDIISQVGRRLTTQCLTHQTGEFELHSAPNWKPLFTQLDQNYSSTVPFHTHWHSAIWHIAIFQLVQTIGWRPRKFVMISLTVHDDRQTEKKITNRHYWKQAMKRNKKLSYYYYYYNKVCYRWSRWDWEFHLHQTWPTNADDVGCHRNSAGPMSLVCRVDLAVNEWKQFIIMHSTTNCYVKKFNCISCKQSWLPIETLDTRRTMTSDYDLNDCTPNKSRAVAGKPCEAL